MKLSGIVATVSFVAAIAVAVECVRTLDHAEAFVFHGPGGKPAALIACHGVVHLVMCNAPVEHVEPWSVDVREMSREVLVAYRDMMVLAANWNLGYKTIPAPPGRMNQTADVVPDGFGFSIGKGTDALSVPGKWFLFFSAPVWAVIPVLLILPVLRTRRGIRQHLRVRRGQCRECGYDLRASAGRCPECGVLLRDSARVLRPSSPVVRRAERSLTAQAGRPGIVMQEQRVSPFDPRPSGLGCHDMQPPIPSAAL
jgi:hypothetical protein